MAVNIEVVVDAKIRQDILAVSKNCSDHHINLLFNNDSLILLGYTETSFCMCKEIIPNNIPYTFRLEDSVLLSTMSCHKIVFGIEISTITVSGMDSNGCLVRQAQVRMSSDSLATYQADFYQALVERLKAGVHCKGLELFKTFDKMSRVNDKGSRGIVLSNNQIFTEGEGFKFFATFRSGFNCFIVSDDMRNLVNFVGENESILYEPNGYIVAKDNKDCYFGVRVAEPLSNSHDLEIVLKQKSLQSFNISLAELKRVIRPIRVSNVKGGRIIFQVAKNRIVLSLGNTVYNIPYEFLDISGNLDGDIVLDFKMFNKLLQAMDVGEESRVNVYNNFISVSGGSSSLLLIARG